MRGRARCRFHAGVYPCRVRRLARGGEAMRRFCVLALLSVVACSEKQPRPQPAGSGQASGAGQAFKSEAALGNKDETCPGGTVRGCWDAAMEAELEGNIARATELYTRVCDAGGAR